MDMITYALGREQELVEGIWSPLNFLFCLLIYCVIQQLD